LQRDLSDFVRSVRFANFRDLKKRDRQMDGRTDGWTDGQTLLKRCVDPSKNEKEQKIKQKKKEKIRKNYSCSSVNWTVVPSAP